MLLEALSRCVGVLTASSKPDDMAVQVSYDKTQSLSSPVITVLSRDEFCSACSDFFNTSMCHRCAGTSVSATVWQPSLRNAGKRSSNCPISSGTSVTSYTMERWESCTCHVDFILSWSFVCNHKEKSSICNIFQHQCCVVRLSWKCQCVIISEISNLSAFQSLQLQLLY